ncbi:MAG: hypothetical protein EKK53_29290 [Burkholderiales bacterium]|nr:MAG: hypothetical protein EKK53_29290 [Burkholderiales bacterium]
MKQLALSAAISLLLTSGGLLAYDRFVVRPAQRIGVVDVSEVYRLKEAEFATLITAGRSEDERQRAMEMASAFARRLPQALEELPLECNCLVVMKSALAGPTVHTIDLTPRLKAKLERT